MKSTPESNDANSTSSNVGRFIVDIRVFMLSITIAMCASFFAGVTMVPAAWEGQVQDGTLHSPSKAAAAETAATAAPCQHVLMDISGVSSSFSNSESLLTDAMALTIQQTGLTMLSYHCHELEPEGISCVAVLMDGSHFTFHTWPTEGVITLDLFTCDSHLALLPSAITAIKTGFGIPRRSRENDTAATDAASDSDSEEVEPVHVKWSHEWRGYRMEDESDENKIPKSGIAVIDEYSDLSLMVLSPLNMYSKEQVYSNLTKYHRVDIFDEVEMDESPTRTRGSKLGLTDGDKRWETPELAEPGRSLFLNGFLVSGTFNSIEMHEALVHPAMFAHPNPKHVAIVGGLRVGAVKEVLKHKTVQSAVLVQQDEELVQVCRQFFPKMSDCSDLEGRAPDCFEDEHVTVFYQDPKQYFAQDKANQFDVIIVNDKDPRHAPEIFSDEFYISNLVKSLSPEGVMMIYVGTAADIDDPRADKGVLFVREQLIRQLEANPEVEAMLVYEEARSGFFDPRSMLIICKSDKCRSRWYSRSDQVDFAIYNRIVKTQSEQRALMHYDGTTQFTYSLTPKAWETVYCRREPTPFECAYLHLDPARPLHDLYLEDANKSSFRVESKRTMSTRENGTEEEVVESRVYATVNIPEGSYIMPKHLASSLVLTQRNLEGLQSNLNVGGGPVTVIEDLLALIRKHGHDSHTPPGIDAHFVEIGGSTLIRQVDNAEEANVGRWVPPHPTGSPPVYSPVYERHRMSFDVFIVATKPIAAGEEVVRHKGLWSGY